MLGLLFRIGQAGDVEPPTYGLGVMPNRARKSRDTLLVLTGTGTDWLSETPTFNVAGVDNVSIGAATVISDTEATAVMTAGADTGLATVSDSTTGAEAYVEIARGGVVIGILAG